MTASDVSTNLTCFRALQKRLNNLVVGQTTLAERLTIGLLANGHLLIEGAPGLAKTRAVNTLAALINTSFKRVQFTPDLLPSDITGTEVFRPDTGEFEFKPGPIFNELILADEINRAPAKVQSALLEAMGEQQVSVGGTTYQMPELFMVVATQNPIEHEGTFQLPQAQLDRFLMHIKVDYPNAEAENDILEIARAEHDQRRTRPPDAVLDASHVFNARAEIMALHMSDAVQRYLIELVLATRNAAAYESDSALELQRSIEYGVSPRATIAIDRCARARAWLDARDYVTPDDVQAVAHDCLRHRLLPSLDAESRGISADAIIDDLMTLVPVV